MNNRSTANTELVTIHAAAVHDLDSILNIDAGYREALIISHHSRSNNDLDGTLELTDGLHAVLSRVAKSADDASNDRPVVQQPSAASGETLVKGAVANLLKALDTPARLAIRNHPVLDRLAAVFNLARARARSRAMNTNFSRIDSGGHANSRAFDHVPESARELTRQLSLDLTSARGSQVNLDVAIDTALARTRDLARASASNTAYSRTQIRRLNALIEANLTRAIDIACRTVDATDLTAVIDVTGTTGIRRAIGIDLTKAAHVDLDIGRANVLASELAQARHDFTTADLRHVDKPPASLVGIWWSTTTKWPSDEVREYVYTNSTEMSPELYILDSEEPSGSEG